MSRRHPDPNPTSPARTTIVLTAPQLDWLRRRHEELGIGVSFTLRRALDEYRARIETAEPTSRAPAEP